MEAGHKGIFSLRLVDNVMESIKIGQSGGTLDESNIKRNNNPSPPLYITPGVLLLLIDVLLLT